MTQPNKGQLIREWQIATGKAMLSLLEWQRRLEVWVSQEVVDDAEFMTAYGELVVNIGFDWPDNTLSENNMGIDQLREAVTGDFDPPSYLFNE